VITPVMADAAAVAGLTVYDMCKALDRGIEITRLRLLEKDRWEERSVPGKELRIPRGKVSGSIWVVSSMVGLNLAPSGPKL
jgi:hypothetical protein